MCPCCCYWDRPGQLTKLQILASVAFPGHVSFPPANGLLHDRALNSMPGPQVAEHWDHSPQSSHSVTGSVNSKHFCSMLPLASKNTWAFGQRAILSLCGVSNTWVGVISTRPSSHSEAVPASWCAGWPASPLVPLTFDFWGTEGFNWLWVRYDLISEDHLLLSHIHLIQFPWDRCLSVAQLNKGSLDEFDFLYIHSIRSSRSILSHKLRLYG